MKGLKTFLIGFFGYIGLAMLMELIGNDISFSLGRYFMPGFGISFILTAIYFKNTSWKIIGSLLIVIYIGLGIVGDKVDKRQQCIEDYAYDNYGVKNLYSSKLSAEKITDIMIESNCHNK